MARFHNVRTRRAVLNAGIPGNRYPYEYAYITRYTRFERRRNNRTWLTNIIAAMFLTLLFTAIITAIKNHKKCQPQFTVNNPMLDGIKFN